MSVSMDVNGNRIAPVKECPAVFLQPIEKKPLLPATPTPQAPVTSGIRASVENIDPYIASEYLKMSGGNRSLRSSHINYLAQQMRDGSWRLGPAAIAFSARGRLIDGHHRLEAIIRAQHTIITVVMRGLPDNCWDAIDCGAVRNAIDRITFPGKNPAEQRRASAMITNIIGRQVQRHRKATNAEIMAAINQYHDGLIFMISVFKPKSAPMTSPIVFAPIAEKYRDNPKRAQYFAYGLLGDPAGSVHGLKLRHDLRKAYLNKHIGTAMNRDWMKTITITQLEKCFQEKEL